MRDHPEVDAITVLQEQLTAALAEVAAVNECGYRAGLAKGRADAPAEPCSPWLHPAGHYIHRHDCAEAMEAGWARDPEPATCTDHGQTLGADAQNAGAAPEVSTAASKVSGDLVSREADLVRGVWARCEALEDEAHDKLAADLSDHERGFFKGQQVTAKSIRRSTEMPRPVLPVAPAVKVKPLVWVERYQGYWAADAGTATFYIAELHGMLEPYKLSIVRRLESFATFDEAKAAAQTEHEATILAALEGGTA